MSTALRIDGSNNTMGKRFKRNVIPIGESNNQLDNPAKDMFRDKGELLVYPSEDFSESLNELVKALQDDKVESAVIAWMPKGRETFLHNWSGSSMITMGLLTRLIHAIQKYVDGINEDD